jgi:hypothetical protein
MNDPKMTVESTSNLEPAEVDPKMEAMKAKCDCPSCPTYVQCATVKDERLFCFMGKSACIRVNRKCICHACRIAHENNLKHQYYCIGGSTKQLQAKHP